MKPLTDFSYDKRRRDGRTTYCRECYAVRYRQQRERKAATEGRTIKDRPVVPDGHKLCPECGAVKPIEDFPRNKSGRRGRGAYCKPCHNAKSKETYTRLYGSTRDYHLKRRYGLTSAEVDAMIEAQGGTCATCPGKPQHVDHDHVTGKNRGVLCFNCNQALGNVRDDPQTLRNLIDYLAAHAPFDWEAFEASIQTFDNTTKPFAFELDGAGFHAA